MYCWLQITLTTHTKIDFPWISFIHLHFFCFSSYYFYMGKFTLDNSNHALSIWKVKKKIAAVVRNIVFILTTMYSLSLLFCQSSFKTESSTVYLYQALKCACCLYSFPTPLSGYLPWPSANSNLFRLQETVRLTITWIWSIIIAIGRILVKYPPPRALTCISCFVFKRQQIGRVVSTSDSQLGSPGFESCSRYLLDLFSVKSRVQILSHACK